MLIRVLPSMAEERFSIKEIDKAISYAGCYWKIGYLNFGESPETPEEWLLIHRFLTEVKTTHFDEVHFKQILKKPNVPADIFDAFKDFFSKKFVTRLHANEVHRSNRRIFFNLKNVYALEICEYHGLQWDTVPFFCIAMFVMIRKAKKEGDFVPTSMFSIKDLTIYESRGGSLSVGMLMKELWRFKSITHIRCNTYSSLSSERLCDYFKAIIHPSSELIHLCIPSFRMLKKEDESTIVDCLAKSKLVSIGLSETTADWGNVLFKALPKMPYLRAVEAHSLTSAQMIALAKHSPTLEEFHTYVEYSPEVVQFLKILKKMRMREQVMVTMIAAKRKSLLGMLSIDLLRHVYSFLR